MTSMNINIDAMLDAARRQMKMITDTETRVTGVLGRLEAAKRDVLEHSDDITTLAGALLIVIDATIEEYKTGIDNLRRDKSDLQARIEQLNIAKSGIVIPQMAIRRDER